MGTIILIVIFLALLSGIFSDSKNNTSTKKKEKSISRKEMKRLEKNLRKEQRRLEEEAWEDTMTSLVAWFGDDF